jgi:hypothetical protein
VLWEASQTAPFTGANARLYGYDITTGQTFPITGASYVVQQSVAVSGTMVVWLDYRAGTLSIYGADVT